MPTQLKTLSLTLGAAVLLSQSAVAAVVLAGWDTSGAANWGPSPFAPTESASGVTVVGLTRGSGLGTSTNDFASSWGASNWVVAGGAGNQTRAGATAAGKFITFSLTVGAGQAMSIESIDPMRYRRDGNGPTAGAFEYQLDSGGFQTITAALSYGTGPAQSIAAIDLTGIAALQNVSAGTTVTFRLVNWGASAGNDGGRWAFNNGIANGNDLAINGTIFAVPAPGAVALLGAAGLIGSVRRRG